MPAKQHETNRKIHLDFHTPHWVKEVGKEYDPELLVQTWKDAHINAVTVVFGLCACGNAYYESDIAPVHPGLKTDMLASLLPVAKREGVQIYVHFSPGINDRSVIENPDWAMVTRDGKALDTDGGKEWGWPCYNSPFVTDLLLPQLADFVPRYPDVQGIFLDMVMYPEDTCHCSHCRNRAAGLGLDLNRQEDMDQLQNITLNEFIEKARAVVKTANSDMEFTCNCRNFIGGVRNENLDFLELEAPITWNSYYYPVLARYIRTLGKPACGMTTRFPKNWGYFGSLNNETQLKFECATIMATLGSCCIGDQLHPSGKPDAGVYDLIRSVYCFVEEREPWVLGGQSVPYIAIMADYQRNLGAREYNAGYYSPHQEPAALYGAGLTLLEGNRHFDVLDEESDLFAYRLLWLPENVTLSPSLAPQIERFVGEGGHLLITGGSLWKHPEWRPVLERLAGVRLIGMGDSNGAFIEPAEGYASNLPRVPYFVKGYFPLWSLENAEGSSKIAAKVVRPYENIGAEQRFGHFHAPAGDESEYPGAVVNSFGRGKVTAVAASLAADYFSIGSRHTRQLLLNFIDAMLEPKQRLVEVNAGTPSVEVSLMSQSRENRWLLHLIQYGAKRTTGSTVVEEVPIRYNIPVTLRPPAKPVRVTLEPSGYELLWAWEDGVAQLTVPELEIHQIISFEFA